MRFLKRLALMAVLAATFLSAGAWWLLDSLERPLPISAPMLVNVTPGGTLHGVLRQVQQGAGETDALGLRQRLGVRLYDMQSGVSQRVHVGEYRLQPGDSLMSLLRQLEQGNVVQHSFTLVEGWNIRELRAALARVEGLTAVTTALSSSELMAKLGAPGEHPEGWFAPDTYFYTRGDTDLAILQRAFERQQALLDKLWAERDDGLPYDTAYEALIMASIVEKETGVAWERPEIAGVFVSRMLIGMRLQTDPTVIYGMGENYQGNIRKRDLLAPTPYNTYVIRGLPPTPIAMPGREAIAAAVHPASTKALFFVARGDGSHKFSATLDEHEAAVREYQLKRRENYRSAPAEATP